MKLNAKYETLNIARTMQFEAEDTFLLDLHTFWTVYVCKATNGGQTKYFEYAEKKTY